MRRLSKITIIPRAPCSTALISACGFIMNEPSPVKATPSQPGWAVSAAPVGFCARGVTMSACSPLAMAEAEIVTILPSSLNSIKVSNTGRVIGAFSQDRLSGPRRAGPDPSDAE